MMVIGGKGGTSLSCSRTRAVPGGRRDHRDRSGICSILFHRRGFYSGSGGAVVRFIDRLVVPKGQQQHGEVAGHGHHGLAFGARAAFFGEFEALSPQSAVLTEGAEDVLGAADEEPAQVGVACLADAQLFVGFTGLVAAGHQAEECGDIALALEARGIADGQDEGQRGEQADAADLAEEFALGILFGGHRRDGFLQISDLFGHSIQNAE